MRFAFEEISALNSQNELTSDCARSCSAKRLLAASSGKPTIIEPLGLIMFTGGVDDVATAGALLSSNQRQLK